MTLRAPRKASGSPGSRVEVLPPDEQPFAPAGVAVPLDAGRDAKGRIRSTATARALAKLPRRRDMLPAAIACDPRFDAHQASRRDWLQKRRSELCTFTGSVSYGVGAMLNAAAWLYAGGEFAAELAAKAGDLEAFKVASALTATARQHDMAAWEQAVREAKARQDLLGATPIDVGAGLRAGIKEPTK